jgi:hypothetical protein
MPGRVVAGCPVCVPAMARLTANAQALVTFWAESVTGCYRRARVFRVDQPITAKMGQYLVSPSIITMPAMPDTNTDAHGLMGQSFAKG